MFFKKIKKSLENKFHNIFVNPRKKEEKLLKKANEIIKNYLNILNLKNDNIVYFKTEISEKEDASCYYGHILFVECLDGDFFIEHSYTFPCEYKEFYEISDRLLNQIRTKDEDIFYSGLLEVIEPKYCDMQYLFKLSYLNKLGNVKDNYGYSEGRVLSNMMIEVMFPLTLTKEMIVEIPIFEEYSPYFNRMPKNVIDKYFQYLRNKEKEYKDKINELERKKDALSEEMRLLFEVDK